MTQSIRQHALDLLARREHSRFELEQKLIRKGHHAEQAAEIVQQLAEENLQCDQRFCEAYINARLARGFGRRYCVHALQQRGVSVACFDPVLKLLDCDFEMALEALWRRKFSALPRQPKEYQKQYRFLLQRGFEPDSVRALLRDLQQGNK